MDPRQRDKQLPSADNSGEDANQSPNRKHTLDRVNNARQPKRQQSKERIPVISTSNDEDEVTPTTEDFTPNAEDIESSNISGTNSLPPFQVNEVYPAVEPETSSEATTSSLNSTTNFGPSLMDIQTTMPSNTSENSLFTSAPIESPQSKRPPGKYMGRRNGVDLSYPGFRQRYGLSVGLTPNPLLPGNTFLSMTNNVSLNSPIFTPPSYHQQIGTTFLPQQPQPINQNENTSTQNTFFMPLTGYGTTTTSTTNSSALGSSQGSQQTSLPYEFLPYSESEGLFQNTKILLDPTEQLAINSMPINQSITNAQLAQSSLHFELLEKTESGYILPPHVDRDGRRLSTDSRRNSLSPTNDQQQFGSQPNSPTRNSLLNPFDQVPTTPSRKNSLTTNSSPSRKNSLNSNEMTSPNRRNSLAPNNEVISQDHSSRSNSRRGSQLLASSGIQTEDAQSSLRRLSITPPKSPLSPIQTTVASLTTEGVTDNPKPLTDRRPSLSVEDINAKLKHFSDTQNDLLDPDDQSLPRMTRLELAMARGGFKQLEHFPVTAQHLEMFKINRTEKDGKIIPDPTRFPDRSPIDDFPSSIEKQKEASAKGFRYSLYADESDNLYAIRLNPTVLASTDLSIQVKELQEKLKNNTPSNILRPLPDGVVIFVLVLVRKTHPSGYIPTGRPEDDWELNLRIIPKGEAGHPGLMSIEEKDEGVDPSTEKNKRSLVVVGEAYYSRLENGFIMFNDKTGNFHEFLTQTGIDGAAIIKSLLGQYIAPAYRDDFFVKVPSDNELYDYLSPELEAINEDQLRKAKQAAINKAEEKGHQQKEENASAMQLDNKPKLSSEMKSKLRAFRIVNILIERGLPYNLIPKDLTQYWSIDELARHPLNEGREIKEKIADNAQRYKNYLEKEKREKNSNSNSTKASSESSKMEESTTTTATGTPPVTHKQDIVGSFDVAPSLLPTHGALNDSAREAYASSNFFAERTGNSTTFQSQQSNQERRKSINKQ